MQEERFVKKRKWLFLTFGLLIFCWGLFLGQCADEQNLCETRKVSMKYIQKIEENRGTNYRILLDKMLGEGQLSFENPEDYRKLLWMDLSDMQASALLAHSLEYLLSFREQYITVLENAKNMSHFKLFSREGSFSQRNIEKTVEDFANVQTVELSLVNGRGLEKLLNFWEVDVILFLVFMAYLFYNVFWMPMEMRQLVFATKRGRMYYALRLLMRLTYMEGLVLIVFYGSIYGLCVFLYGPVGDIGASAQSLEVFASFPYAFTILRVLCQIFLLKFMAWLAFLTVSVWLWVITGNSRLTGVILICSAAVCLMIYRGIWQFYDGGWLACVNPFSILDVKFYYSNYLNMNVWGFPVSVYTVMVWLDFGWLVMGAVGMSLSVAFLYPGRSLSVRGGCWAVLRERFVAPLIVTELYKVLWIQKGILILAAFVWFEYNEFQKIPVQLSTGDSYLNYLYEEYGGVPDSDSLADLKELRKKIEVKRVQLEQDLFVQQAKALSVFIERYDNLLSCYENGENVSVINPSGFLRLTFRQNMAEHLYTFVKAIVFIVMFLIPMNRMEYRSGMAGLIHISGRGTRIVRCNKSVIFGLILITAGLLFFGSWWLETALYYPMEGFDCSMASILEMDIRLPVWAYFLLVFGGEMGMMAVVGAAVFLITDKSLFSKIFS